MKLKLKNFRCYLEKEFDFGSDGLLLLSGPSGAGKSSLLMAITYALYGKGNKLATYGKTSCEVVLEFSDLVITRTKRPNRLVVTDSSTGEEYEDEAAQSVIDTKFGTAFNITSYVQQNAINSFIMMNPTEKLEFLEKFAFQGVDLSKIKARCQATIKKRNEELIAVSSQLEVTSEHFSTLSKPEKVSFPVKTKDKEKFTKNETIRLSNSKKHIKHLSKNINTLTQELQETKIVNTQIEGKKELLETLNKNMQKLKSEIVHVDEQLLKRYKSALSYIEEKRETEKYDNEQKLIDEMIQNETEQTLKEIDAISSILWKQHSQEEIQELITDYTQLVKDTERLDKLVKNYTSYEPETLQTLQTQLETSKTQLLEKKKLRELYECPSCNTCLRFENGKLYNVGTNVQPIDDTEISTLTKLVSRLESQVLQEQIKISKQDEMKAEIKEIQESYDGDIPSKKEAQETLDLYCDYQRTQNDLQKKLTRLRKNSGTYSAPLQNLIQQHNLQKPQQKYQPVPEITLSENELRQIIHEQTANRSKNIQVEKQISATSEEIRKIETQISTSEKNLRDISTIENELSKLSDEMKILVKEMETHEKNLAEIEVYKKYKETREQYKDWESKVETLSQKEEKNKKQMAAATLLKEKILEAESIALLNIINSINTHAQEYLDIFFPNDPIVVRLAPFKETKKSSKPQVNLEIDYKGMSADINMLSGGELARVVLAYTLALSEIFNSPLILLDESTASLDQDMTSIVMDGIRKNFGNKLVIVIAHQVISGDFDRQISL